MVTPQVGNTAVSEQLTDSGSSLTIPSGEVWRVTIMHAGDGTDVDINGDRVITGVSNPEALETILTGGTTIDVFAGSPIHIGGFKVS